MKKFRDVDIKPVVSVGDIATFCSENSNFSEAENDYFILNWQTANIEQKMFFRFCMCTPHLLAQFEALTTVCIDATYKLNWNGFPLILLGTVDRTKRFHPLFYGCSSNETADDYAFFFNSIKEGVKKYFGKEFDPQILIADGESIGDHAIRNATFETFPQAKLFIMCYAMLSGI